MSAVGAYESATLSVGTRVVAISGCAVLVLRTWNVVGFGIVVGVAYVFSGLSIEEVKRSCYVLHFGAYYRRFEHVDSVVEHAVRIACGSACVGNRYLVACVKRSSNDVVNAHVFTALIVYSELDRLGNVAVGYLSGGNGVGTVNENSEGDRTVKKRLSAEEFYVIAVARLRRLALNVIKMLGEHSVYGVSAFVVKSFVSHTVLGIIEVGLSHSAGVEHIFDGFCQSYILIGIIFGFDCIGSEP